MKIQKNTCSGIDCALNRLQDEIYYSLSKVWSVDWNCYPRIYKNKRKDERGNEYFVPEYIDGNYEYSKDTLFDDKVGIVSFFLKDDKTTINENHQETDVSLIFSAKINDVYTTGQREDELFKMDIFQALKQASSAGFKLNSIEDGLNNVYKEFRKEDLTWSNLSNRCLLRFNFTINYNNC